MTDRVTGGWRGRLLHMSYTTLLYLALPLLLARLLWRGFTVPAYWQHWRQRFGLVPKLERVIWLHAVSVGEVNTAACIVDGLFDTFPDHQILVTTLTPTGSARARELFGDRVAHLFLPFDLPPAVHRFLDRVRPQLAIIMETEIWPNLWWALDRRGIPSLMANARISERSLRGYLRAKSLTARILNTVDRIAAQTQTDAQRLRQLGADPSTVVVTGSLKYEIPTPADIVGDAAAWRSHLGPGAVWIAASTHADDETPVLIAHRQLRRDWPELKLILVPRHPDRIASVRQQLDRHAVAYDLRSKLATDDKVDNVLLVDTLGELMGLYAAADIAFVGGSLANVGGHNVLEPASLGLPVLTGPHVHNFAAITSDLIAVGGALQVSDADELQTRVDQLLRQTAQVDAMGQAGKALVAKHHQALPVIMTLTTQLATGAKVSSAAHE